MPQPAARRPDQVGLFVNPAGRQRALFQRACAELFGRLILAEDADGAAKLLGGNNVDLLVIDLERLDPTLDMAPLRELVAARAGAPTLLLCPAYGAAWLAPLLEAGAASYAIHPLDPVSLRTLVMEQLAGPAPCPAAEHVWFSAASAARRQLQEEVMSSESGTFGSRACSALCSWPGVVHAALLAVEEDGNLRVAGEHGHGGLDLAAILQRGDWLGQSPWRYAFPGLMAISGDLVLVDAPEKTGAPELAAALRGHGVEMALGIPVPGTRPGEPRGALSLLFAAPRALAAAELEALRELGLLAGLGLELGQLRREREQMQARVVLAGTTDELTGATARKHGEELLEREIRRALRYRLPLSLVHLDIDGFRTVNESYGVRVGDLALCNVASAVQALLRESDTLVRYGAGEFLVIAPHTAGKEALALADKLRAELEAAAMPGCDHVTVSVGVAQMGEHEGADALAMRAGAACRRAKCGGGNRVELALR